MANSITHGLGGLQAGLEARSTTLFLVGALMLGGCSRPVEKVEEVRSVRAITLVKDHVDVMAEFSGEVRPRFESRLGFRVGGKIVERKVDVGSIVKSGQLLMRLDPQDLKLAQAQADANLKAATSNRALAEAEFKRYRELREKNFVSQAVLDSKKTAFSAAQASYEQARAAYRNQGNQVSYATLYADTDGVVTGIDAEVGQVVAAGAPVVRVARTEEKDVVIDIPEDKIGRLQDFPEVRVRTWAKPEEILAGVVREVSPVADPATRTYAAKIAIPDASEHVLLGMTAYVEFAAKTPEAMIKLPLTAVFQDKGKTAVWVVEDGSVKPVTIQIAGASGNQILAADGLAAGQTIVTAGVNLLKPGQKVKILGVENVTAEHATPISAQSTAGEVK